MAMIDTLKQQHKQLISVMDQIASLDENNIDQCDNLFQQFKALYKLHDEIEDEIVYPTLQKHPHLKRDILKSYQAHHVVEVGLLELRLLPYNSENWVPKFLVIRDSILTHIEEEENKVFPKAQQYMGAEKLLSMDKEINARVADNKNEVEATA